MNKKLRVLFCMLFAAIAVFALALVACDDDNSNTSTGSESSSTTDGTGSSTGGETHTHTYSSDPTVTWVEQTDGTYDLTVTLTCSDATCGETTSITATVTSEVTTAATKLAKGVRTYTGKYTYNGTDHTVTKEVEIPALATIYDAQYLDLEEEGSITEGTSLFGSAITTVGSVYWYNNVSSSLTYTDTIVTDYEFAGRLYLANSSSGLTFTLSSAATVTVYTNVSANYDLKIVSGTATDGTTASTFTATDAQSGTVTGYSASLAAGTYTICYGSNCNIFAIMLEGNDYTDGAYNYTAPTEDETGDNQFELVNSTEYTFTATEAGYYTFTIPSAGADIWAGEADYDDSSDGYTPTYINSLYSETSFEVYLEKDATIVLYLTNENSVVVTYTVSETSGSGEEITESVIPTTLATDGTANVIVIAKDNAYDGVPYQFTATIAGDYTFSVDSDADAYIYVGNYYTIGYYSSVTCTLAANQTITITFMTYSENAATYNFYITYVEDTGAVIPTSLNVPGDTEAVLNSTNSYYYLTTTVTTGGTYTFTLTGDVDDLEFFTVYYGSDNDRDDLDSDNNYTLTVTCATGDTIGAYAYLLDTVTENASIKLTISVVYELALDTAIGLDIAETENDLEWDTTVTYTVSTAEGETTDYSYYLTLGGTSSYWNNYLSSVTVTVNGTAVEGTNYNYNMTLKEGVNTIVITYTGTYSYFSSYTSYCTATLVKGEYTPVVTSINEVTDSDSFALKEGDNAIALSTTDAKNGISLTFKPTTAGLYSFTIDSESNAKVTVGTTTLQVTSSSSSTKTTVSFYLTANQELTIKFYTYSNAESKYTLTIASEEIKYTAINADETTTLTLYTDGVSTTSTTSTTNYAFIEIEATETLSGEYYIEFTGSSSYWNSYLAGATATINGTAATISDYKCNVTLTAGTTYNVIVAFSGAIGSYYSVYARLVKGTYTPVETVLNDGTDNEGKIVLGDNEITLSNSDAKNGYETTFKASTAGIYTFTVESTDDADVYLAASKSAYNSNSYLNVYSSYTTTISVSLEANQEIYILLKTSSESTATYSLTISQSTEVTSTELSTTAANLTLYADITGGYVAYAKITTTELSGSYTLTLGCSYSYGLYYAETSVTVNGTAVSGENNVFNLTLTAGETYSIVIYISYADTDYTYTAVLESGSVTVSALPTTLAIGTDGNTVTLTEYGAYYGVTATYTLAAGTYKIYIDTTSDACVEVSIDNSDYDYFNLSNGTSTWYTTYYTEYEFTVAADDEIEITFATYSGDEGSYKLYITEVTDAE